MANLSLLPAESPAIGRAIDAGTFIRSVLLAAVFLLLWISFRPFENLAEPPEVAEAGNLANQIGYSMLFGVLAVWCVAHDPRRLMVLVRPVVIAALIWCALSVATSWEPSLSARRFAFTLVVTGIAGMVLLLPKSIRHFSNVLAPVVLIVLVASYLGVFLIPSVAIHQLTDFADPQLAGDWRGVFGHKNEASATMAAFIFIGLFVARIRSVGLGALIILLAATFLVFTQSKTSMAMLPITLIVSTLLPRIRRPAVGIAFALSPVVVFNLLSVGSIYLEPIHNLVGELLSDPTFTGRTDIWQFAVEHLAERPITGYGFASFWGTPQVVYGMGGSLSGWANTATHAHNGYLNLALTIGIPGAALVAMWLVVLPLIDFYRPLHDASAAPLKMLFLRVCVFSAYASCFESMLIQGGGLELFLFAAAFGLRFLAVSRVTR